MNHETITRFYFLKRDEHPTLMSKWSTIKQCVPVSSLSRVWTAQAYVKRKIEKIKTSLPWIVNIRNIWRKKASINMSRNSSKIITKNQKLYVEKRQANNVYVLRSRTGGRQFCRVRNLSWLRWKFELNLYF